MDSDASSKILLQGQYSLQLKSRALYRILVTSTQITWLPCDVTKNVTSLNDATTKSHDKIKILHIKDVIGCDCQKGNIQQRKSTDGTADRNSLTSKAAYLCVYAYPMQSKLLSKTQVRKRSTLVVTFDRLESFGENFAECLKWKEIITCLASSYTNVSSLPADVNLWSHKDTRKFLVLINPASGPGKASELFRNRVLPMLAEASIQHHVITTKRALEGLDIVSSVNISEWYGIVIVSGDGLIYEVINGLMSRPDWSQAIQTPIGIIPAGSGNALCSALLCAAKEPVSEGLLTHATFMLLKHVVSPLDLMSVDVTGGKRLFSFLHVAWGLVSDVDIESEKFRSLGNARFTVGAVIRIANLRKYRGRLSFLPVDPDYKSKFTTSSTRKFHHHTSANQNASDNHDSQSAARLETSHQDTKNKLNDGAICKSASKTEQILSDGGANASQGASNSAQGGGDFPSGGDAPSRKYLPASLDEPLSEVDGWVTIEDDFVSLVASLQTHAAQDFVVAPNARIDDGCIHLLWARHGLSRLGMVKMLSEMEKGKLTDSEWLELVPVKAFRLVPLSPGKNLTVDGERVEYGPIQAEVLPSVARVMSHRL